MSFLSAIEGISGAAFQIGLGAIRSILSAATTGLSIDRPLYVDGFGSDVVTITSADSPYTPGDEYTVLCDCSAGNITISLPPVANQQERIYRFFKIDSSGNTLTLDPDGAETIDGMSSYSLSSPNKGCGILAGTAEWKFCGAVSRNSLFDSTDETFGFGLDGDVTVAGTTTLTVNAYYNNLVVTGTLDTDRYAVLVYERLSGNGTISDNGSSATSNVGASNPTGSRFLGTGASGGAGFNGSGAGTNGSSVGNSLSFYGAGAGAAGAGGAGDGGAGGTGGTTTGLTATDGGPADPWVLLTAHVKTSLIRGGAGGGGGGSALNSRGGGGGAGGNVMLIRAAVLDFSGTISSRGGNGFQGQLLTGVGGGGGGGGGGGNITLVTRELRTTPTFDVSGGTAGVGVGTGVNGTDGSAGYSQLIQMVQ